MKKWSELNKHEKEKRVMFALLGAIALAASVVYGVLPFLDRLDRREAELEQIEENFRKLERLDALEDRNARALEENCGALRRAMKEHMPPVEGPFLWATEQVYGRARSAGVEILSLTERRLPLPAWVRDPSKPAPRDEGAQREGAPPKLPTPSRRFAPYAVQLSARGSYHQLVAFLAALERSSPYLRVAVLHAASADGGSGPANISMTIEWPWHVGTVPAVALQEPPPEAAP